MTKHAGILALALVAFLAVPRDAAAQTADGPFYSRQHLVDYWASHPDSSAQEIFLNGYLVYQASGFGPAYSAQYFQCTDGLIRTSCNSLQGPFVTVSSLKSYVWQSPGGTNTNTYLDNVLIQSGFGPLFGTYYYKTCTGDRSPYSGSLVKYYVLQSGSTIYGPVAGLACLPRL